MELNPLVFLLAGVGLLVATLTIAILNKKSFRTENPYDEVTKRGTLADALFALRNADTLYRAGVETGERLAEPSPPVIASALTGAGLGAVEVVSGKKRLEFVVRNGPNAGSPQVDEPLCYFTLGILRGALRTRNVHEEMCHGTGSPYCLFRAEVIKRG